MEMSTVVDRIDQIKPALKERFPVPVPLYVTLVGGLAVTAAYAPSLIKFWPFSAAEFVQRVIPLFLISAFIERALEVFVTTWRGPEAAIRDHQIKVLRKEVEQGKADKEDLGKLLGEKARCKCKMQRMAFAGSVALGIMISSVGVRALGLFVDPNAFSALSPTQRASFNMVDVLLTGAMLGGGSDALHKFITVFTNFMDRSAKQAKGDTE
jgi:hypothetical protein